MNYTLIGGTYMNFNTRCQVPIEIRELIHSKYNVVGSIDFKAFDNNFQTLRNFFIQHKKDRFDVLDRFWIEHQDTDIYISEMSTGVNLRNMFQVIFEIDIPLYTIIIWTNHFGLQKEIDLLCKNHHLLDRPTVIESFCATRHVASNYNEICVDEKSIQHHALCMMGSNRSHRFALYNSLKHVDPNKLAISIKGLNQ
jgi:hypothetical protein